MAGQADEAPVPGQPSDASAPLQAARTGSAPKDSPPKDPTTGLAEIAEQLRPYHRELSESWAPDGTDYVDFWRLNLAKVKTRIDMIQTIADKCRKLMEEKVAGEGQIKAMKDLDAALRAARINTQAALRALQAPDDASQSTKQSELHIVAVDHLTDLAEYCEALVQQLRGV